MRIVYPYISSRLCKGGIAFVMLILLSGSNYSLYSQVPFSSLGYAWEKTITIDAASGSTPLNDFPLLLNFTDVDLKDIANGGHVYHSSGFDIAFIDENGYKLDHEIEIYTPAIGQIVAWVRIPALSNVTTT